MSRSGARFWRRHKILTALAAVVGLVGALVGGGAWYLNHRIDQVPRFNLAVPGDRPPKPSSEAMNILLAGADKQKGTGPTIAQAVQSRTWQPGSFRSDTIMLLHLTADRQKAYLISVPRDTYVHVDGHGMQKINAAFSYGGPALYVHTLEQLTRLRIDHVAIMDWNGFRDLSKALGGVRVFVAEDSYDSSQKITWHKGWHTVRGARALSYVRQRHGLPRGDFDRIRRQQNFLRATFIQAAHQGMLSNPLRYNQMLNALTASITVDSGLSDRDLRHLAGTVRGLRAQDVTFIQLPFQRFARVRVGSVVIPDLQQTRELFRMAGNDHLPRYLRKYGGADVLAAPTQVD